MTQMMRCDKCGTDELRLEECVLCLQNKCWKCVRKCEIEIVMYARIYKNPKSAAQKKFAMNRLIWYGFIAHSKGGYEHGEPPSNAVDGYH